MSLLFNMQSRLVVTFLPICNLYLKDVAIIYICFHLIKLEGKTSKELIKVGIHKEEVRK